MANNDAPASQTIDISTRTILKILVILIVLGFLWFIRDILLLVLVAVILASVIDAPVDWLDRKGVPRALGVIFIYLLLVGFVTLAVALVIPPIAEQARDLANQLPQIINDIAGFVQQQEATAGEGAFVENIQQVLSSFGQSIAPTNAGGVFGTVSSVFGGIFQVGLVLVLTFYMVVEEHGIRRFFRAIAPAKHAPYITQLINRIQKKIGAWFRGQLLLGLIVGVLTYIGLTILGVEYALVLALLAGILEIVPYVGPILSAIPAIFLAFGQGPLMALFVLILFIIVQQIENNILAPKIMEKAVGLNPVVVIVVLLIGAKVAGFAGLLLAVPVATGVAEFASDFFGPLGDERKKRSSEHDSWLMQRADRFSELVRKANRKGKDDSNSK